MKIEKITYRGEYFIVEASLHDCSSSGDDAKQVMKRLRSLVRTEEQADDHSDLAGELRDLADNLDILTPKQLAASLKRQADALEGIPEIPF